MKSSFFRWFAVATCLLSSPANAESTPASSFPVSSDIQRLISQRDALVLQIKSTPNADKSELNKVVAELSKLLDARVAQWTLADPKGQLAEQMRVCEKWRQLTTQEDRVKYFDNLRIGGFLLDQTLDIALAPANQPLLRKEISSTVCLLGPPLEIRRTVNETGERVMWVWPRFFVHTVDAIVVSWSDR